MIAQMSVRFILALKAIIIKNVIGVSNSILYFSFGPSAGIGRQDKLKIYWFTSWTFKSFFGYKFMYVFYRYNIYSISILYITNTNIFFLI